MRGSCFRGDINFGTHITQFKHYEADEADEAQPSLDIFRKIIVAFSLSTDWSIFEEGEREPRDELKLNKLTSF